MSARMLDGRAVASRIWRDLSQRVATVEAAGDQPRLAIVRFDRGDIARSIGCARAPFRARPDQAVARPSRKKRPVVVTSAEAKPAARNAASSSSAA